MTINSTVSMEVSFSELGDGCTPTPK